MSPSEGLWAGRSEAAGLTVWEGAGLASQDGLRCQAPPAPKADCRELDIGVPRNGFKTSALRSSFSPPFGNKAVLWNDLLGNNVLIGFLGPKEVESGNVTFGYITSSWRCESWVGMLKSMALRVILSAGRGGRS